MECREIFRKPMHQSVRLGSDEEFWSRVFFQLSEAEEAYARKLQKVIATVDARLGMDKVTQLQHRSKDYDNLILHVETFKEHILSQQRKTKEAMENNRNTALELRRASNNQLDKTVNVVDAVTMDNLTKELKKKEHELRKAKTNYHGEMAAVERTKIKMLRLGYNKDTLDSGLEKHERRARDALVRYKHALRQAENQTALLTAAANQCERDWKETEADKTQHVLNMIDNYLKVNCHTCYESKEKLSGFVNVPRTVSTLAEKVTLPSVEFEDYEMPLLRLVMSKLKSHVIELTNSTESSSGYFEYGQKKVRCCHVTRKCSDKRHHFLSLKKGTEITELIPPSSQGWAFGEVRDLRSKCLEFGFYNIDCVQYITTSGTQNDADDDTSGKKVNVASCMCLNTSI